MKLTAAACAGFALRQHSGFETAIYSLGNGARAIEAAKRSVHNAKEEDGGCRYIQLRALDVGGAIVELWQSGELEEVHFSALRALR
jgi:hypothetical protein